MKEIRETHEITTDNGKVVMRLNGFVGYEHYCDKDPKTYTEWYERNKKNTYEVYKHDCNDCYEPTEVAESFGKMIEISKKILKEEKEDD